MQTARSSLDALGWSPAWAEKAAKFAELQPARVVVEHKERYQVLTQERESTAVVSGKFRHRATENRDFPAVGDWILFEKTQYDGPVVIQNILPRNNSLIRQSAGGGSSGQVLAANLDTLFIVTSCNADFNLHRIQRFLALAHSSQIRSVILLSKLDLIDDPRPILDEARECVDSETVIVAISARTGEGLDKLEPYLSPGQTVALVGSSGVGKSTLVNRVINSPLLAVQSIRELDDRGRHTTVSRQLIPLPDGGLLIDTPGIREVGMYDAEDGLRGTFSRLAELSKLCRFTDCQHDNEPGCGVLAAVASGEVSADQLEQYRKLKRENEYQQAREDVRLQQERKRKEKELHRLAKDIYKRDKSR